MAKSDFTRRDLYQEVTDKIIASLERGTAPWVKPWQDRRDACATMPYNYHSKRSYHGINTVLLWAAAYEKSYTSPAWLTFKQALDMGGHVRKGEKGQTVIFWKFLDRTERDEQTGEEKARRVPMAKAYTVFNLEQCEGIEPPAPVQEIPEEDRHATAEAFILGTGAEIIHGGNRACYIPSFDRIHMPHRAQFLAGIGLGHYYATALHEITHWTGHKSRCARDLNSRFGTESYAAEELIAELGAAFLCAQLGIEGELQHPQYIESWLRVLKQDNRAIFTAARLANQAADYLSGLSNVEEVEEAA